MNQFLSPKINTRTDEVGETRAPLQNQYAYQRYVQYGGSLENRARFILDIVNAMKAKLPSDKFVIAAKLNCQDCKGPTKFPSFFRDTVTEFSQFANSHEGWTELCRAVRGD